MSETKEKFWRKYEFAIEVVDGDEKQNLDRFWAECRKLAEFCFSSVYSTTAPEVGLVSRRDDVVPSLVQE